MTKAVFNTKRALFANKIDLDLKKKLVQCYSSSIAFGVETLKLRSVDQEHLRF
jgi:hypothetical protein